MLFNSLEFGVFLFVGWLIYRALERRAAPQLFWLLSISAFFYGCWKPWYLILVALSTLLSYVVGVFLDRTDDPRRRKTLLVVGVAGDLLLLATFKYGNFVLDNVGELVALAGGSVEDSAAPDRAPGRHLVLHVPHPRLHDRPLQAADPPREEPPPLQHLRAVLPAAGRGADRASAPSAPPARRTAAPRSQGDRRGRLPHPRRALQEDGDRGHARHARGDPVLRHARNRSALESILALWSANFQVYCDFSGYSDVAMGAALLFGISLPINFDRPFISRSPMEHWRRWHISLSTWLRDYLYFPLGGIAEGTGPHGSQSADHVPPRRALARGRMDLHRLGALQRRAARAVAAVRARAASEPLRSGLEILATFHAICFGLVFLHARSFDDAWAVLSSLVNFTAPARMPIARWGSRCWRLRSRSTRPRSDGSRICEKRSQSHPRGRWQGQS